MINVLFALLLVLGGCGYTTGSLLPSNFRSISIEPFKNKTSYLNENSRELYIPLLENKVHDSIVQRFQNDGHLKVEPGGQTDLVLKGELSRFDREELRVNSDQNVTEYRLRITVNISLYDPAADKEVWREDGFSGEATYFLSGPQSKSESEALEDTLTDLSRRVVERTLENW